MTPTDRFALLADFDRIINKLESMRKNFAGAADEDWRIIDQLDQAESRIQDARLRCENEHEV